MSIILILPSALRLSCIDVLDTGQVVKHAVHYNWGRVTQPPSIFGGGFFFGLTDLLSGKFAADQSRLAASSTNSTVPG